MRVRGGGEKLRKEEKSRRKIQGLQLFIDEEESERTFKNYQSRLRWFKGRWTSYSTLIRFSSGFGYDPSTKRFTATNEVCDEYLKAHPNDTDLRYGTYEDYEDLEIAIGNGVAVGKKSIGLGSDVTDARTLVVEEGRKVCIEDFDYDIENEVFVKPTEDNPSAHPTSPLQSPENLEIPRRGTTQNKRSRAEYEGNSNSTRGTPQSGVMEKLDKLHFGFESMITLLEKRDRQSKIWDAIKEIPNLDEATCFTALELLDTKTKKDAFFNMSPQERMDEDEINGQEIGGEEIDEEEIEEIDEEEIEEEFYETIKSVLMALQAIIIVLKENMTMVTGREVSSYCNRHGIQSQNVLAACNLDLQFIYVLSGWEGSAHDSKLLNDALSRRNGLEVPQGKYFLVDCGFANRRQFLAPLRGVRYHLKDFGGQGRHPRNASELFNLRHASLRNVIERIFENDSSSSSYLDMEDENLELLSQSQLRQRAEANAWRLSIAEAMWRDRPRNGDNGSQEDNNENENIEEHMDDVDDDEEDYDDN
ncbi:hypothetical protein ACLB2K_034896 [Fragaria x ananassa]